MITKSRIKNEQNLYALLISKLEHHHHRQHHEHRRRRS